MRKNGRTDANQDSIVKLFRELGASVWITSQCGHGAPDLVVGIRGRNILVELKDGAKVPSQRKLTPLEEKFHSEWKGQICVIKDATEAIALINRLNFDK